jgi:hypothetical protein
MLGLIAGLSYIYCLYTPGIVTEKVLGIAVTGYGTECGMSGIQIARLIDIVGSRFKDLSLISEVMHESYKKNREAYLEKVVLFYAGAFSNLPPKRAGEILSYLFPSPKKEINSKDYILFYMGMDRYFMKKLYVQLGYSDRDKIEFIEEWDKNKYWRKFFNRIKVK